jgi:hypothetical protein
VTPVSAIRPTGIRLERSVTDEPHLTERMADVAFRGRGYEYAVDLLGLGRLSGVFARHRVERGEEVGMRLAPGGLASLRCGRGGGASPINRRPG